MHSTMMWLWLIKIVTQNLIMIRLILMLIITNRADIIVRCSWVEGARLKERLRKGARKILLLLPTGFFPFRWGGHTPPIPLNFLAECNPQFRLGKIPWPVVTSAMFWTFSLQFWKDQLALGVWRVFLFATCDLLTLLAFWQNEKIKS